jgi:hypothetical protein
MIFIYPTYTKPASNDFALFNLTKALTINTRTQPIKLPPDTDYRFPDGTELLMSGRGGTFNPLHSTELLKGAVTKTISVAECNFWTLTDAMICLNYLNDRKGFCGVRI